MSRTFFLFIIFYLFSYHLAFSAEQKVGAPLRPEHPRPDFSRERWQSLNGKWEFQEDANNEGGKERWQELSVFNKIITVPFPIESSASGIKNQVPKEVNWYALNFDVSSKILGQARKILHFGAIDYQTQIWLNSKLIGTHTGGYASFELDVTEIIRAKDNRLVIRVYDPRTRTIARGKQEWKDRNHIFFYTSNTGIWQSVWLEGVADLRIQTYQVDFAPQSQEVSFRVRISRMVPGHKVLINVHRPILYKTEDVTSQTVGLQSPLLTSMSVSIDGLNAEIRWPPALLRLWSVDQPFIYPISVQIIDQKGTVIDQVHGEFGLRHIEIKDGNIFLNGSNLYQKLLLEQGYYPEGLYTATNIEQYKEDMLKYKEMGFNGIRKHQKIEDPWFYTIADRMGLLVWSEMPAMNFGLFRWNSEKSIKDFETEWYDSLVRDYNHPSIIAVVPFNENWGILQTYYRPSMIDWASTVVTQSRKIMGNRLMVDNSGGYHFDTDIFDFHQYSRNLKRTHQVYQKFSQLLPGDQWNFFEHLKLLASMSLLYPPTAHGSRYNGSPLMVSEMGGFGYFPWKTSEVNTLENNYQMAINALLDYPKIRGFCYTQAYDTEQEKDGLLNFDRSTKVDFSAIRAINEQF